jgi:excisionase family DNA binding protein
MGELLTIKQAAERLNVTTMTVRRHIEAGDIAYIRPGREYLIDSDVLAEYEQKRRGPGRPSADRPR